MGFEFKKLSVLVVEDTPQMSKLICSILETLGVGTIYTASEGRDAYSIFFRNKPDIIITEWYMEPISGIQLIQQIRQAEKSPNRLAPIIMMTGYSAMPRVRKARDLGVTEFLVKPFSANDLTKRIAHIINRPRDFIKSSNFFGPDRRRLAIEGFPGPFKRTEDGHAI